ncbi:MAG: acetyl-CoA carboxylase biotin carboxylase subunit [bacterium]|jgi:acetyl-CoA carboxylase biotin carboxylase subunit
MFKKVLIANRGEIAVRVIKALRELGIKVVCIYSQADKNALHVKLADEAYDLGDPLPINSYLNIDKIIEIAKKARVDAIHPGYGFLSENSLFAKEVENNGIKFIGPNYKVIELLGDKIESRKTAFKAGVPISLGLEITEYNEKILNEIEEKIGFPVMIKASKGGGGKGIRIVYDKNLLKDSIESAQREALNAFGDKTVYIEKYFENPRHIEVQIIGDEHGNILHLYERECSIQQRFQKIIEETPSPTIDDETRYRITQAAKKLAQYVGYYNAGTVEFIVDKNNNFYFLEVNTRLQVEHPITEITTNIDIVKTQILVAAGHKLSINQEDIKQNLNVIEVRVNAEDPENNFISSPGQVKILKFPNIIKAIRIDTYLEENSIIPPYYDSLVAKVITWDKSRINAINKMILALKNFVILPIKTNKEYVIDILSHPEFINANIHTNFIIEHMKNWRFQNKISDYNLKDFIGAYLINKINIDNSKEKIILNQKTLNQKNKEYSLFSLVCLI